MKAQLMSIVHFEFHSVALRWRQRDSLYKPQGHHFKIKVINLKLPIILMCTSLNELACW